MTCISNAEIVGAASLFSLYSVTLLGVILKDRYSNRTAGEESAVSEFVDSGEIDRSVLNLGDPKEGE